MRRVLRQWPPVPGAALVHTQLQDLVEVAVGEAIADNGVAVIDGPSGTGKTTAVETVVAKLAGSIPVYPMLMAEVVTVKELTSNFLHELDVPHSMRPAEWQLRRDLVPVLDEERRIFVLDEVRGLGRRGFGELHYLREATRPCKWTLILVGTNVENELRAVPALDSRAVHRVPFQPWEPAEAVTNLRAMHPVFKRLDAKLLARINRDALGGNFRAAEEFLKSLLRRLPPGEEGKIPDGLVWAALANKKWAAA